MQKEFNPIISFTVKKKKKKREREKFIAFYPRMSWLNRELNKINLTYLRHHLHPEVDLDPETWT